MLYWLTEQNHIHFLFSFHSFRCNLNWDRLRCSFPAAWVCSTLSQTAFCLLNYQSLLSSLNFLFIGCEQVWGTTPVRKCCVLQSRNRICTVGSLATCTPGASQLSCWTHLLFICIVSCSQSWPVRREAAKGINCTFHLLNDGWLYLSSRGESPCKDLAL